MITHGRGYLFGMVDNTEVIESSEYIQKEAESEDCYE